MRLRLQKSPSVVVVAKIGVYLMSWRQHDLVYLAGLFDGEGTIGYRKRGVDKLHTRLEMEIKMADEPVIDWLVQTFGGTKVKRPRQKLNHKDQWRWRITADNAKSLYESLRPWLKIKNNLDMN